MTATDDAFSDYPNAIARRAITLAVAQQPGIDAEFYTEERCHKRDHEAVSVVQRRHPVTGANSVRTLVSNGESSERAPYRISIINAAVLMPITVILPS